jgi:hypothetical protein
MNRGQDDHIVPQQMIKRFADDNGDLIELIKPELKIGTHKRKPKSILFRENYYKDEFGNLDDELLKKVEQRFAIYYPKLADEPWREDASPDEGAAFIDWVAALMCRTQLLVVMTRDLTNDAPLLKMINQLAPKMMDNLFRTLGFCENQDLLTRPGFKWKCLNITIEKNVIITDNPICLSGNLGQGKVVIVPISKRRIIFGGTVQALQPWGQVSVDLINMILGAHAERHIFAADKDTLSILANNLRGEGEFGPDEFCEAARKPLFGLPDRVISACRSNTGKVDTSKAWKALKDSYGASILDRIKPRT